MAPSQEQFSELHLKGRESTSGPVLPSQGSLNTTPPAFPCRAEQARIVCGHSSRTTMADDNGCCATDSSAIWQPPCP